MRFPSQIKHVCFHSETCFEGIQPNKNIFGFQTSHHHPPFNKIFANNIQRQDLILQFLVQIEPKLCEGNMPIKKNNSHPGFTQIILCSELCLPTTKYNLQQCLKTQHNRATINSFTYSHCTFSLEYKYNLNQRLKIPPMYIVQIC